MPLSNSTQNKPKKKFDLKATMDQWNQQLNDFLNFVTNKLKNYKNLSLGEQIAYPSTGLGIIMILTSVVLFII